jgi:hypothetical protein
MDSYTSHDFFGKSFKDHGSLDRLRSIPISPTTSAYAVFAVALIVVARNFSECDFSAVLTLAAGLQSLAFGLLSLQLQRKPSTSVSPKMLMLYALVCAVRLTSTLNKNGYLPVDKTGDWVYQTADIVTLAILVQLIFRVKATETQRAGELHDTMQIRNILVACFLMGCFVHSDLNASPFFDKVWTISMNLDTVAMAPQLFLMSKIGGEVDCLMSHFVALVFMSRLCAFSFWYYAYPELAPLDGSWNLAGFWIVFCHAFQIVLSGDFMYYYIKSTVAKEKMILPGCEV